MKSRRRLIWWRRDWERWLERRVMISFDADKWIKLLKIKMNPYNQPSLNLSSLHLSDVDHLDEDELDQLETLLNQESAIAYEDDWYGILNLDLNVIYLWLIIRHRMRKLEILINDGAWSFIQIAIQDLKRAYFFDFDSWINQASAQEKFQKIQKAYDGLDWSELIRSVLSNPETRAAYDKERDQRHKKGWQVGKTYQSPEDVILFIGHFLIHRWRMNLQMKAKTRLKRLSDYCTQRFFWCEPLISKNSVKVNVDASRVFDKPNRDLARFGFPVAQQPQKRGLAEMIQWPEITQVMIKNSWKVSMISWSSNYRRILHPECIFS